MLSKDLAIYTFRGGRAFPDRLTRRTHAHYVPLADRLLSIYRKGQGKTRDQLHRAAEAVFQDEPDCPPRRIRSFLRLLDRGSAYRTDVDGRASRLRQRAFELAARRHPLVMEPHALFQHAEKDVKQAIATEMGISWAEIERDLYADLPAFHRLESMEAFGDAEELLRAYNVAQAQTLLFWSEEMTVTATEDFRRIIRHVKFNRLLHEVQAAGPGAFRIRLTGPASVLGHSRRYGVDLAKFLPGLLACRGWQMCARLKLPYAGVALFEVSPQHGLRSHLPPGDEFDSEVERDFAAKFGYERENWRLQREGGFLVRDQKVFIPDFTFRHTDGTEAYLEIVGFWTPEYLERKRATLALFADAPIVVALAASRAAAVPKFDGVVIRFTSRLAVRPVLETLDSIRDHRVI